MTISGNTDVYGARVPGIWTHSAGYFHICFAVNGNKNYCFNTKKIPINKWVKVRLSQQLEDSQYIYKIFINGQQVVRTVNSQPREFKNVKVYSGDPWYEVADAYVRNFRISSKYQ